MTTTPYSAPRHPYAPGSFTPASVGEEMSQFERLGFNVLLVFIFLTISRIFDVKFGGLHITGAAFRVVLAMVLLSRAFVPALKTPIGKAMLGFTVCMCLSVPFSVWRTGSKNIFIGWAGFSFVAFLAVAGLVGNYQQWLKAQRALLGALFVFVVITNVFGVQISGRLFLEQGKFANPNEMAQILLLGLPMWGAAMVNTMSGPKKVFAGGVMLLMLATTFRTGSRGAMIAFVVMIMVAFIRASIIDKLKLIMAGVLFVGVVVTIMPGRLVARYKTVAGDVDTEDSEMDAAMMNSAASSTDSRRQLLMHSLIFTMRHPIFGVGPGMFTVADDEYAKSQGKRKGSWLGTHNSYTQVSSEIGIPAFLFYLAAVILSLTGPLQVYRKTRGDPRLEQMGTIAMGLYYTMLIYAVTVLFEHIAYTAMLPIFGGFVAALVRVADAEIERIKAVPLPPTMSTAMFRSYLTERPRQRQLGQSLQ
ncbi:MAG: O-antigen ligase family protein [Candidatus Solibacter sp.]